MTNSKLLSPDVISVALKRRNYALLHNVTLYTSPYVVASNRGYSNSSANPSSEGLEGRRLTAPLELFIPYGEPFVDEHVNSAAFLAARYTFSGKERDEETGYSNFGARYLDASLLSSWFSVDPMADKYPSLSPYNYCAWNPIKLIDPNGEYIDGYEGSDGSYRWFEERSEENFVDNSGITWTRVTNDKSAWEEATTIRNACIEGLISEGFAKEDVERDVRLFDSGSDLFTKETKLLNAEKYIDHWKKSFNSNDFKKTAKACSIKGTSYSLKFYANKGNEKNALGIVLTDFFFHTYEAQTELMESVVCRVLSKRSIDDPYFDMHYNNAIGLLS